MPTNTPPAIPERIRGLADVANNLAWSWHREARALFPAIDEKLWHLYRPPSGSAPGASIGARSSAIARA